MPEISYEDFLNDMYTWSNTTGDLTSATTGRWSAADIDDYYMPYPPQARATRPVPIKAGDVIEITDSTERQYPFIKGLMAKVMAVQARNSPIIYFDLDFTYDLASYQILKLHSYNTYGFHCDTGWASFKVLERGGRPYDDTET
jgi:hypothetical protein